MNKIREAFKKGKVFIPFITCGDPDLETTEKIVYELEKAGADIIELGIPFSDPTAEGVVIMDASNRALAAGTTTKKIFEMVKKIRKNTDIPLVFMTYANILFSYGIEKFVKDAKEIGINGIILPDVPFEEKKEFFLVCEENNIAFISLIAPTSNDRIEKIVKDASGFLYIISSLGVTGIRSEINTDISKMVNLVRNISDVPTAVGFGISSPEQAKNMAEISDGVIVGSAIVKIIAEYGKESPKYVYEYVKKMKEAIL